MKILIVRIVNARLSIHLTIMKKTIAIVTGGYSGESVISYKTAETALKHMDSDLFDAYLVDIRKDGWFVVVQGEEFPVDKNDFSALVSGRRLKFDFAYFALHGTPGEDGKLQGYFDMVQIPYNTGNTLNLSVTFNKKFTTSVLQSLGFQVAKSLLAHQSQSSQLASEIESKLRYPLFVKPNNGGSSIGISKVYQSSELAAALQAAFAQDPEIIVEEYIEGREFTCGVGYIDGAVRALPITEIVSHNDFFDYQAKYEGASEEITPAPLPDSLTTHIQQTVVEIYQALSCKGIVRIDFILNREQPYVIEINTIPGMSSASIIPQQLQVAGYDLKSVITAQISHYLNAKR